MWVCSTYIVLHLSELNLYYECMTFLKEIKEIREVKHLRLRQTANANLYHVIKFLLYLSFTVHYFYTYNNYFHARRSHYDE